MLKGLRDQSARCPDLLDGFGGSVRGRVRRERVWKGDETKKDRRDLNPEKKKRIRHLFLVVRCGCKVHSSMNIFISYSKQQCRSELPISGSHG